MKFIRIYAMPAVAAALLAACGGTISAPAGVAVSSVLPLAQLPKHIYLSNYNESEVTTYSLAGKQVKPTFSSDISNPHFIAVWKQKLFVANSNYVQVTSYNLKTGAQTTPTITQNLRFSVGIAVNAKGIVYVSDYLNGTVTTYSAVTGTQQSLTISGLSTPVGIAVDKQNKVYVAQSGEVSVFDASGSPNMTITAGVDSPQSVSVDAKGKIYVSNCPSSGKGSVTTYEPDGKQTKPTIKGLVCPQAVAIDSKGTIYVADTESGSGEMTTYSATGKQQSLTIKIDGDLFGLAL